MTNFERTQKCTTNDEHKFQPATDLYERCSVCGNYRMKRTESPRSEGDCESCIG